MTTREKVVALRKAGKTYEDIREELGITKSTIYWHASERNRADSKSKRSESRRAFIKKLKVDRGAKCETCGYDKCLAALHFHHKQSDKKVACVAVISRQVSNVASMEEAKKCSLICANCHAEEHWPDN